ncbi:MAG: hypothetical protein ACK5CT_03075 [Bacteroidota bacterium]|jgi:hypothetical protein
MRFSLPDTFKAGFVPGLLLPLLGFYLYYLGFFQYMGFDAFVDHVIRANLAVSVLSLGVILNLGLFFLYFSNQRDQAARGVIGATLIYGFVVLYFKVLA